MLNSSVNMKPGNANESRREIGSAFDRRINQTIRNLQGLLRVHPLRGKASVPCKGNATDDGSIELRSNAIFEGFGRENICNTNQSYHEGIDYSKKTTDTEWVYVSRADLGPESSSDPALGISERPSCIRCMDSARIMKFRKVLSAPIIDLDALRELAWSGVPPEMKPVVWRLLLGYVPLNFDRRENVLLRRRQEYLESVSHYYNISDADRSEDEIHMLRQISLDAPRTVPEISFLQQDVIQASLKRILYIWAIRHPASGYVQGMNDLVTPFLIGYLSEHLEDDLEHWLASTLEPETISNVEADCYWSLSKFLDGIQDHYTFAQPGIQQLVFRLKELVQRIDEPLLKHMENQSLEFLQFAFRWINCLLIREIPFVLVPRLWDTFISEGNSFSDYLLYLCASFLLMWSKKLRQLNFQEMVLFLQHLPTKKWTNQDLEGVLSRAFVLRAMFSHSPRHLRC